LSESTGNTPADQSSRAAGETANAQTTHAQTAHAQTAQYGKRVGLLTIGIGVTGLVTFAYFFVASHVLSTADYGGIALLWSVVFVVVSVLYRPIEQLLARTVAERQQAGDPLRRPLEIALAIQLALGAAFAVVALAFRPQIQDELFGGDSTLFWIMLGSVLAYAASYFARGLLAGAKRVGLYGLLVFVEAVSRFMFAVVVAVGLFEGADVVALGVLAAPVLSLFVVPFALARRGRRTEPEHTVTEEEIEQIVAEEAALDAASGAAAREEADFTLAHGTGFAFAAIVIMAAEQTFLNAGPLVLKATGASAAVAGYVFNLLLIARAPVQLFQSVSTSLLPHLSTQRSSGDSAAYRHSISVTLLAIAGFAGVVTIAMLIAGPFLTQLAFSDKYEYDRLDLALVGFGMGFYLAAATLNQSALADRRTGVAAGCWAASAAAFVIWLLLPVVSDDVLRIETGFLGAAMMLCASLAVVYLGTLRRLGQIPEGGAGIVGAEHG
jgi:O-antigen/teichoic acid export membrane protein